MLLSLEWGLLPQPPGTARCHGHDCDEVLEIPGTEGACQSKCEAVEDSWLSSALPKAEHLTGIRELERFLAITEPAGNWEVLIE